VPGAAGTFRHPQPQRKELKEIPMYATPIFPTSSESETFRRNLGAVYARHAPALRDEAHLVFRQRARAYDAVQDAFLAVLENPPADASERSLAEALRVAFRRALGRHQQCSRDDRVLAAAARERIAAARSNPMPT